DARCHWADAGGFMGKARAVVGVEGAYLQPTLLLAGEGVEAGLHERAGPAPVRPVVDQDGDVGAQHLLVPVHVVHDDDLTHVLIPSRLAPGPMLASQSPQPRIPSLIRRFEGPLGL